MQENLADGLGGMGCAGLWQEGLEAALPRWSGDCH